MWRGPSRWEDDEIRVIRRRAGKLPAATQAKMRGKTKNHKKGVLPWENQNLSEDDDIGWGDNE